MHIQSTIPNEGKLVPWQWSAEPTFIEAIHQMCHRETNETNGVTAIPPWMDDVPWKTQPVCMVLSMAAWHG